MNIDVFLRKKVGYLRKKIKWAVDGCDREGFYSVRGTKTLNAASDIT